MQVVGRGEHHLHAPRKGTVLRECAPGPQGSDAASHLTDSTGRGRVASTLWIKTQRPNGLKVAHLPGGVQGS